ncbi:MAG: hypothetical protein HZC01_01695 [Candidatus Kerfeldbacteria bacterium]|nr:hypothetical protein [Candidatus Kerfeldbacteria bacterium]
MTAREVVVAMGALLGYPVSCFSWIIASYRKRIGKGWHFFGISLGGFVSWAMLISSFFTNSFVKILLVLGSIALYLALMGTFLLLVRYCQKLIDKIEAERYPHLRSVKQV